LSLDQVRATAEAVSKGLAGLAAEHAVRFVPPEAAWYGLDPVHVRRSQWRRAWAEILGVGAETEPARVSKLESLRLYRLPVERRWVFGRERFIPQAGTSLPAGGRVWLY
jgi:hypothetical protein